MPYLIKNLIEAKPPTASIGQAERASTAIETMTDGDFSQLPVVDERNFVQGLITSDSILKAARMFKVEASVLTVRDCQVAAKTYIPDTDIFEVLVGLASHVAAVIVRDLKDPVLVGIITDYDTAGYFRERAESAMMIQEIEGLLKEFIRYPFSARAGSDIASAISRATALDWGRDRLKAAIAKYQQETNGEPRTDDEALELAYTVLQKSNVVEKARSIDDLAFKELMLMFLSGDRWAEYAPAITLDRALVNEMLDKVREIRNKIAHFRGEVSKNELDTLRRCLEWLRIVRPSLEKQFSESQEVIVAQIEQQEAAIQEARREATKEIPQPEIVTGPDERASEAFDLRTALNYSALGRWLSGVPNDREFTWTSFAKFAELIGVKLPDIAYEQRSWWANDWADNTPGQLWLPAGWEVEFVNLDKQQVRFRRGSF